MFKSFGAKVLGYDLMPNKALTDVIEYVSLDEGLKQARHCDLAYAIYQRAKWQIS